LTTNNRLLGVVEKNR